MSFPDINPKEMSAYIYQKACTKIYIALLFTIAPKWKRPKYLPTVDNCGLFRQWNTS